jgi:hypothetical protein
MGIILRQLGNQRLLNQLFMVEEIVIGADQIVKEQDQGLNESGLKIYEKPEIGKLKKKR